jgi:uncharacterized membrane protein YcaP (DUF421 family)
VGNVELWTVILRSFFIYIFVMVIMRMMGKREIGKLSVFDVVVSIMIADFAVLSIEDLKMPLINGIMPIIVVASAQILLSYISLKNAKIRHIVDGEPIVLIRNGKIQEKEMARHRYNLDDLLTQLREKNIAHVGDVEFALLETTGKLSVFPKKNVSSLMKLPLPVIIEGRVQEDALEQIGQNRFWLKNQIQKYGYRDLKEIFFASIDQNGKLYIDPRKD